MIILLIIRIIVITWIGDKSILYDDAPIIPNLFIVIKDLLIGIVAESILFDIKLTIHDFIVVIIANGLLIGVVKHISVNIPASWLGRPLIHHYRLPST